MTHRVLALALALAAPNFALIGCTGGSETGNPAIPASLTLALHSTDPSVASVGGDEGLVVTSAWVHVSEIELVAAEQCTGEDDEREVELPGPFYVAIRDAAGSLQNLLVRERAYCGIEVELERAPRNVPDDLPAELSRNTLVVAGRTPAGRPVVVVSQAEHELEIFSAGSTFTVDELTNRLLLSFDVARWFEGLDLDALTVSPDGTVRVSLFDNPDALATFDTRVRDAMQLARDRNENGALDDDDEPLLDD
jgi:hypothetical protein